MSVCALKNDGSIEFESAVTPWWVNFGKKVCQGQIMVPKPKDQQPKL